jgi:methyl-accepting chemotaxis protein
LVDQAGATMQEIVDSIRRVTDIMGEITAASQEQTAGIEQVNQAIMQMDETTQQNAALVEQAAAAAQSMQEQAGKLSKVVSVFRLGDRQVARAQPSNPVARSARTSAPAARTAPQPKAVTVKAPANPPGGADKKAVAVRGGNNDDWEEF